MSQLDQKIIERFDELIAIGREIVAKSNTKFKPADLMKWVSSARNLIQVVAGEENHFQKSFDGFSKLQLVDGVIFRMGIVESLKEEYERGFLISLQTRITADVFDDFLEQSEYLLEAGYYQAAAVTAGAVLEDGLRKLCERYPTITLPEKPALDYMNGQLAKAGAYVKLTQKRVTVLAELRNNAAHGKWELFNKPDVEKMIPEVRDFMEKYFCA